MVCVVVQVVQGGEAGRGARECAVMCGGAASAQTRQGVQCPTVEVGRYTRRRVQSSVVAHCNEM